MMWLKLFLFVTVCSLSESYKILGIFSIPSGGGSHYTLATRLFTEIANKGHEVTLLTASKFKPIKNVRQIHVDNMLELVKGMTILDKEEYTPLECSKFVSDIHFTFVKHFISSHEVQNLLKSNEKFDGVLIYQYLNEALSGIAHHYKAPVILFSSMPLYVTESFLLSHPAPSSYVPNLVSGYTGRMNFWQRLRNSFYDSITILHYQWFMLPKHRELVRQYIPGQPDLYQFLNNASLVLVNSHVSTNDAIPYVPNAIEIGGYHIEEPKPLPEDIKRFLDESSEGVILFSLGSYIRSADLPKEKRDDILKAFAKLKQNVLWKFEDDNISGLPKNVKVMKWLPQSDILAHPNIKAFISHGGLLSTMESVYHAVPIVGIPIFVDQKMNIALAVSNGYALQVPYREITEEKLSKGIDQILKNPKYRNNIKKRSKIMRDRPIKPTENALYWIEYVIRHEGAHHLRYPGMELNWFQRNLIDIVGFVLVASILPILIVKYLFKKTIKHKNKKE